MTDEDARPEDGDAPAVEETEADFDRDALVRALDRLGDADDAAVLHAAREAATVVAAAGMDWDEVIAEFEDEEDGYDEPAPRADLEDEGDVPHASPASDEPVADDTSGDLARIQAMLQRGKLSSNAREDLEAMKQDIAAGEFSEMDREYLRALERRVTERRAG